jgi:hypothetical protein
VLIFRYDSFTLTLAFVVTGASRAPVGCGYWCGAAQSGGRERPQECGCFPHFFFTALQPHSHGKTRTPLFFSSSLPLVSCFCAFASLSCNTILQHQLSPLLSANYSNSLLSPALHKSWDEMVLLFFILVVKKIIPSR